MNLYFNENFAAFALNLVGVEAAHFAFVEEFTATKREGTFVERAGNFGFAFSFAGQAAGEDHLVFVWAGVLNGIPFFSIVIKDGDLIVVVLDADAETFGEIGFIASFDPSCLVSCFGHF